MSSLSSPNDPRPLPGGWIVQWDPEHNQQIYVDIRQEPPRVLFVHPLDESKEEKRLHLETNVSSRVEPQSTGTSNFSSNNPYRELTQNSTAGATVSPLASPVSGDRPLSPPSPLSPIPHDTKSTTTAPPAPERPRDLINPRLKAPHPSSSSKSGGGISSLLGRSPSAKQRKEDRARQKEEHLRNELARLQALEEQRIAAQTAYYQQQQGPQPAYGPGPAHGGSAGGRYGQPPRQYHQQYPPQPYYPQQAGYSYLGPQQNTYNPPPQQGPYGPPPQQQQGQHQRHRFPGGAAAGLGGGLLLGGLGGLLAADALFDGF